MELWKFGGNELKMHIWELFNKIVDKNQTIYWIQLNVFTGTRRLRLNLMITYRNQFT
jgi:hypothetical protein